MLSVITPILLTEVKPSIGAKFVVVDGQHLAQVLIQDLMADFKLRAERAQALITTHALRFMTRKEDYHSKLWSYSASSVAVSPQPGPSGIISAPSQQQHDFLELLSSSSSIPH